MSAKPATASSRKDLTTEPLEGPPTVPAVPPDWVQQESVYVDAPEITPDRSIKQHEFPARAVVIAARRASKMEEEN